MDEEKYYSAHLHMHSCHEGVASMKGHMYMARQLGVDIIWFTDHDTRMGLLRTYVDGFSFDDEDLFIARENKEIEKILRDRAKFMEGRGLPLSQESIEKSRKLMTANSTIRCGWQKKDAKNPATTTLKLIKDRAYKGEQCLNMKVESKGDSNSWQSGIIDFFTNGKRHQSSLLGDIQLKLACFLEAPINEDTRVILEVTLSEQPPEHKKAKLKYVIGDTKGLEDEYSAVIKLDALPGAWNELSLDITKDAKNHPKIGGIDNVFDTISIILQTRNGKKMSCLFDDFRIIKEIEDDPNTGFEESRRRQQELADVLGKEYGVIPFVATEVSGAGYHKNSFCSYVPIINYYERDYNITNEDAIAWIKKHNGIFSKNHPFSAWNRSILTKEQQDAVLDNIFNECITTRCDGADMIEIGFPEGRYGFSLDYHLRLWDRLSKNGIFITGYGCSDNHSNSGKWLDGNNFVAWIYAKELKEEYLIESMASGNLYTGDPVKFKGQLRFNTDDGHNMGEVIKADKPKYTTYLNITKTKPGWSVKWIVDGELARIDELKEDFYKGQLSIEMAKPLHFVRAEIYDDTGRCIILTNPIYFVTDDNIHIPANRKALDI